MTEISYDLSEGTGALAFYTLETRLTGFAILAAVFLLEVSTSVVHIIATPIPCQPLQRSSNIF